MIGRRLKELRKTELHLTQAEMAATLGIAVSTYSMIESGQRTLKDSYIKLLAYKYHINTEWLKTGQGDMYTISSISAELMECYNRMSPAMKRYFVQQAKDLVQLETEIKEKGI